MNPKLSLFLSLMQNVGLLARAVTENNNQDFILYCHKIRSLMDTAIAALSVRIVDLDPAEDNDY